MFMQAPRILKNPALFIPVAITMAGTGFYTRWFYIGWLGVLLSLVTIRLAQVSRRDGGFDRAFSGFFFPTLILIVGGVWVIVVFARIVGWIATGAKHSWAATALALALIAVLHIGSSRLYGHMIRGFMSKRSSEAQKDPEPDPPTSPPASDIAFREYIATSDLPPNAESERIIQHIQHPSTLLFYRGLMVALLAGVLVNIPSSYWLSRQAAAEGVDPGVWQVHINGLTLSGLPPGEKLHFFWMAYFLMQVPSTLLALGLAALVFYERGRIGWVTVSACIALSNFWRLIGKGVGMFPGRAGWIMAVPPTLMAAIVCVFFAVAERRSVGEKRRAAAQGRRLLVLRVFGVFGNTQSLFRLVTARWQCSGPILTIADPGYARLQFAEGRFLVLLAAFVPLLLILSMTFFMVVLDIRFLAACFVVFYIPFLTVYFARQWLALHERFAHTDDAIRERIVFESGREGVLAARYHQGTVFCLDDTWKPALRELADWADIVLMDLRAFTQEHQGCQYELAFLIDRFPLERAVLLVSESTDRELLKAVLSEHWQRAAISSPNRLVSGASTVALYRSSAALRHDVPQIVGLLARAATNACQAPARAAALASVEAQARWVQNGIRAAAGVIVFGVVLEILFRQNAGHVYSGVSVAWIGIILMMLATRMRAMLECDGHFRNIFRGFPWPQVFSLTAGLWFLVYIY
jgi:hypothetical protein